MIAVCPSCARRWVLPADRVGRGGARVRCAGCDRWFVWAPARTQVLAAPEPVLEATSAVAELDETDATPPMVARLAVEELVIEGGPSMLAAWDEGRLFERCGAMIVRAWDHCRERLGDDADPAAFRDALRARLGIDLPGGSLG